LNIQNTATGKALSGIRIHSVRLTSFRNGFPHGARPSVSLGLRI